jgi:hypothetical protein
MTPDTANTNTHGSQVEQQAEAFVAALLETGSVAEAAARVGIARATGYRWLRTGRVKTLYRSARRALVTATLGRLLTMTDKAAGALERGLTCGDATKEVQAARSLFAAIFAGVRATHDFETSKGLW